MSEFKFACPVCGQHITADSAATGSHLECPTCYRKIVVPQAPASADPKFVLSAAEANKPRPPRTSTPTLAPVAPKPGSPAIPFLLIAAALVLSAAGGALYAFRGKLFKPNPPAASGPGITVSSPASPKANIPTPAIPAPGIPTARASGGGDGNNLALNKPAMASSHEPRNPVENGNDGDDHTRWCASSGRVPQWWEVDLGATAAITNIQILWEKSSRYQYVVNVSSDKSKWTVAADRTTNASFTREDSDACSVRGRYVRLVVTGLQPGSWASFFEFRVLGSINTKDSKGDGSPKASSSSPGSDQ
jgi:DNA-directed RNA polymerase subunit RPC12/RpoP